MERRLERPTVRGRESVRGDCMTSCPHRAHRLAAIDDRSTPPDFFAETGWSAWLVGSCFVARAGNCARRGGADCGQGAGCWQRAVSSAQARARCAVRGRTAMMFHVEHHRTLRLPTSCEAPVGQPTNGQRPRELPAVSVTTAEMFHVEHGRRDQARFPYIPCGTWADSRHAAGGAGAAPCTYI